MPGDARNAPPGSRFQTLSEQLRGLFARFLALNQKEKAKLFAGAAAFCYFSFIMVCIVYSMTGVKAVTRPQRPVVVYMDALPSDFAALRYLCTRADVRVGAIVLSGVGLGQDVRLAVDSTMRFLTLLSLEGARSAANIPVYYGDHVASQNAAFDATFQLPVTAVAMPNASSCTYARVVSPEGGAGSYAADQLFGAAALLAQVPLGSTAGPLPVPLYADPASLAARMATWGPTAVLSLAAMTDVAGLFAAIGLPRLRSVVADVIVAGGAVNIPGDVQALFRDNTQAEMNCFFDPIAAQRVLQQKEKTVLVVTADAAKAVAFPPDVWAKLVSARLAVAVPAGTLPSSAAVVAAGLAGQWSAFLYTLDGRAPADLLAAVMFAEPALLQASVAVVAPVDVVAGTGRNFDGTVRVGQPGATGGPQTVIISNRNPAAFWQHVLAVDRLPFPTQN